MTVLWTGAEAAAATGGRLTADFAATGISIDSRTISPGDLFVALSDQRDGHYFVADALSRGATGALVSRVPDGVSGPCLIVDDVLAGLGTLAAAARARSGARVVAVTGSAGKTSTKEMLRTVLSGQGRTHAAEASYNNHWGVPLTLARMPADTEFAVIEIGMNHPGEIAPLARLARPQVAVVTTVAAAHLAAFEDIAGIAREKADIFRGLGSGGVAIFNGDLEVTPILCNAAKAVGARAVAFGQTQGCAVRAEAMAIHNHATVVTVTAPWGRFPFKVMAPGRHHALNALAVLAAVDALGADPGLAAADLASWVPPVGRGLSELILLDRADDRMSIELIDDAFNANPASMAAGLEVLAAAAPCDGVGRVGKGRRVAILGDMLELGPEEGALHRAIADDPSVASIDVVHCVGPRMQELYNALPPFRRGRWSETADDMAGRAPHLIDAGDVVLVKGSKSSHVSRVVDALRKLGQRQSMTEGEAG